MNRDSTSPPLVKNITSGSDVAYIDRFPSGVVEMNVPYFGRLLKMDGADLIDDAADVKVDGALDLDVNGDDGVCKEI
jgi:hypothetical protein